MSVDKFFYSNIDIYEKFFKKASTSEAYQNAINKSTQNSSNYPNRPILFNASDPSTWNNYWYQDVGDFISGMWNNAFNGYTPDDRLGSIYQKKIFSPQGSSLDSTFTQQIANLADTISEDIINWRNSSLSTTKSRIGEKYNTDIQKLINLIQSKNSWEIYRRDPAIASWTGDLIRNIIDFSNKNGLQVKGTMSAFGNNNLENIAENIKNVGNRANIQNNININQSDINKKLEEIDKDISLSDDQKILAKRKVLNKSEYAPIYNKFLLSRTNYIKNPKDPNAIKDYNFSKQQLQTMLSENKANLDPDLAKNIYTTLYKDSDKSLDILKEYVLGDLNGHIIGNPKAETAEIRKRLSDIIPNMKNMTYDEEKNLINQIIENTNSISASQNPINNNLNTSYRWIKGGDKNTGTLQFNYLDSLGKRKVHNIDLNEKDLANIKRYKQNQGGSLRDAFKYMLNDTVGGKAIKDQNLRDNIASGNFFRESNAFRHANAIKSLRDAGEW